MAEELIGIIGGTGLGETLAKHTSLGIFGQDAILY